MKSEMYVCLSKTCFAVSRASVVSKKVISLCNNVLPSQTCTRNIIMLIGIFNKRHLSHTISLKVIVARLSSSIHLMQLYIKQLTALISQEPHRYDGNYKQLHLYPIYTTILKESQYIPVADSGLPVDIVPFSFLSVKNSINFLPYLRRIKLRWMNSSL